MKNNENWDIRKKLDLNTSAVRFYVNDGLLTPVKENEHYEFGKECVLDMQNILKYKKYQFSLDEIQLLFFMEKASHFQDKIVIDICANILKEKRNQLVIKKENLIEFIDDIEKEIESLSASSIEGEGEEGVPFSYIPYLYCPVCQIPLKIDSASLSNGSIQKGDLWCVDSVKSMKEQFSANYRMLIKKAYIWMYNTITSQNLKAGHIMAGPFTLNFLFEYIEKLGENNIYIVFDPSYSRIKTIKKYLSNRNHNIVYIVGSPGNLSIKNKSIDVYIDDYSTVNSLFTYSSESHFHQNVVGEQVEVHGYLAKKPVNRKKV